MGHLTADPATGRAHPILEIDCVSKSFPGTRALIDFSLDLVPGEIHGLVGANGSGKSTLIKILSGVQPADSGGRVRVTTESIEADRVSPEWARAAGIRSVHQESTVFPDLSVAENLALGSAYDVSVLGRISWPRTRQHAQATLARFEIDVDKDDLVRDLRLADRTMLEIARVLQDDEASGASVLLLDEVTAALPAKEAERVLEAVRSLASRGQAVMFVSHALEEVIGLTDRVTVLRDGRKVACQRTDELSKTDVIEFMLGRSLDERSTVDLEPGASRLELRGIHSDPLEDVDVTVRTGEILGLAGLQGSGTTELLEVVFGARECSAGVIVLDGQVLVPKSPTHATSAGLGFVPRSRTIATFPDLDVAFNLVITRLDAHSRGGLLFGPGERAEARDLLAAFGIRATDERQRMSTLSGGNQQKTVVARWIAMAPKVLLLDEPTEGVDVGARNDIYRIITTAARDGMSVVVASSDLEELLELCDRVVVLGGGRVRAEVETAAVNPQILHELVHSDDGE